MVATRLGLYELLAPQFLLGITISDHIDRYLSQLGIDEMGTVFDDSCIVYRGQASFSGKAGAAPILEHREPGGGLLQWDDLTIGFRLTLPRNGADRIRDAVDAIASLPGGSADLENLFDDLGPVSHTPSTNTFTDYPGFAFRLELLLSTLTLHFDKDWLPGKLEGGRVVPDTDLAGKQDVKLILAKVVLEIEQGNDVGQAPGFNLRSWGNSGFDAPADLAVGELVRMEPPLAISKDGRVGIAIDRILHDFSPDHTPPEILELFGTDEGFQGLYFKSVRVYYADEDKDWAFNFAVEDALFSFDGQVSFKVSLDLLGPETQLKVDVKMYNGSEQLEFNQGSPQDDASNVLRGGQATAPDTSIVHVHVIGGTPPYVVQVNYTGPDDTGVTRIHPLWDSDEREARISPGMFSKPPILQPPGAGVMEITVEDASPTPLTYSQTLDPFTITATAPPDPDPDGTPADRPSEQLLAKLTPLTDPIPDGYSISHAPAAAGTMERITITGPSTSPKPQVTINNTPELVPVNELGQILLDVPAGETVPIRVTFPGETSRDETFELLFTLELPRKIKTSRDNEVLGLQSYVGNDPGPADERFVRSIAPSGSSRSGADALRDWLLNSLDPAPSVRIEAHASFNSGAGWVQRNQEISDRRLKVAVAIVNSAGIAGLTIDGQDARGHSAAEADDRNTTDQWRVAKITGTLPDRPDTVVEATISRPAAPLPTAQEPQPPAIRPPEPPPPAQEPPPVFRRLSFLLHIERNRFVLGQVSGTLDFETELESALRNPDFADIQLRQRQLPSGENAASASVHEDGVVDFELNVSRDPATNLWTETFRLGAGEGDRDGLLEMQNPADEDNTLKDIFGAVLLFAPIINSAAADFDPDSAGSWIALGGSLAVPIAIGGLDIFQTRAVTLYGGELLARQYIPPQGEASLTDTSIVFDYGVAFEIEIDLLNIRSSKPLKVRYRAVGFNLHFPSNPEHDSDANAPAVVYQPIFDTSKGYELDLSDPALFNLPSPLGDLLKVLGARLARHNPLTLELDLGLKVDLGVITVDRFRIRVPLEPVEPPMILPTGVKIDLSNVLVGSGKIDIRDDGLSGSLDLTLVQLKLRIAASLAIETIHDDASGRSATAVRASLVVEFPSPIVLGASGVGIFGLSGFFAMHYRRLETPASPGDSVSPALRWLVRANGEPTNLFGSAGEALWGPEFDRWSFGVGLVLGTLEGGFLINFRGMLVLELPGPRILIFVKVQIVKQRPPLTGDSDQLTVGILGVIDLDFNLEQLTIGVIIDYEIRELITLKIPVEIFFKLDDAENWHLHIGTFDEMVTAQFLNLVRARGYFMIGGQAIDLPHRNLPPVHLPGIAVATGLEASVTIGDTDIGLYLRVAVGAHIGVAFSPFFLVGQIFLEGELRIFIVSIEASGHFDVEAPDPTYIHGVVCGKVDFFFFSVEGCVDFSIGEQERKLPIPSLVRNLYLQSYAPVIVAGQGGDRPIDASLGSAVELEAQETGRDTVEYVVPDGAQVISVPVDSVPVLQLHGPPAVIWEENGTTEQTATFTEVLAPAPGPPDDGWINVGGGRKVKFILKAVELDPPLPPDSELPPAIWRRITRPAPLAPGANAVSADGAGINVDLALFSREPTPAARAVERSTDSEMLISAHWQDLCKPIAPPACVFWSFCGQPIGPSGSGWRLEGLPQPDPPGTVRTSPPPTSLFVEEPELKANDALLHLLTGRALGDVQGPARILGSNSRDVSQGKLECHRALQLPTESFNEPVVPPDLPVDLLQEYRDAQPPGQWISFHTGPALSATFLVALSAEILERVSVLVIRELDAEGNLLSETPVEDIGLIDVNGTVGLPDHWIEPGGPWFEQVVSVASFLGATSLPSFRTSIFTVRPQPGCDRIQLMVLPERQVPDFVPRVLVGAIEVCSQAEADRAERAEAIRTGTITTVSGYLNGNDPVPLLVPNTEYTLTIGYDAISRDSEGRELTDSDLVQKFRFKTDDRAPERLAPWVLGTTPDHEAAYHFYEDPLKIAFNDLSILQLFGAYGRRLQAVVRRADGVPVTLTEPDIERLDPVTAQLSSPYRDTLRSLVEAGLLPCMGAIVEPVHGITTVAVKLQPLMAYILDIESRPSDPSAPAEDRPDDQPVHPLARYNFVTSRYASMAQLARELQSEIVQHRLLNGPLGELATPPAGDPVRIVPDQVIETALTSAGETALPAPDRTRLTLYWVPRSGGGFMPHALLIDASEPLWRTRSEPGLETVPDQTDDRFRRAVLQQMTALEITELSVGGPLLSHYVRSPAGTRTLAFLPPGFVPPGPDGVPFTLGLSRPASSLYDLAEQVEMLTGIQLTPIAPWETDDE